MSESFKPWGPFQDKQLGGVNVPFRSSREEEAQKPEPAREDLAEEIGGAVDSEEPKDEQR